MPGKSEDKYISNTNGRAFKFATRETVVPNPNSKASVKPRGTLSSYAYENIIKLSV